jgi:outer membrane protein
MKLSRHALPVFAALLFVALVSAVTPLVASAQAKIAVVDLQRAIHETEEGRKAQANLKTLFESRQKGLDKKQEELKKLKEEIEKQQSLWTPEVRQTKVESYQKQIVELQQVYVDYQRELAEKESELTKSIVERMERILRRIGQAEGYALIIDRGAGVIFAPTNLDLTDVVIQRYNAGEGADGKTDKAAPKGAPKTDKPAAPKK